MSKETSADLILKLYELRREDKMREARAWFISFFPESATDILNTMIDESTSAKYRMVSSYWDMAASMVNLGAIDEEMFMASAGEAWVVLSKIHPYLDELREMMGNPNMFKHLESLLLRQPNGLETLAARREQMKRWMEARAARQAGG
ncbi:MAG: hypothetical protein KF736_07625 [Acidobacteria bacterium]|nr:hypothetical protein [Acidobacteriota bacterium]MCW5949010.1 hypothetical protein [Pyrinomonadaceae bacterium]